MRVFRLREELQDWWELPLDLKILAKLVDFQEWLLESLSIAFVKGLAGAHLMDVLVNKLIEGTNTLRPLHSADKPFLVSIQLKRVQDPFKNILVVDDKIGIYKFWWYPLLGNTHKRLNLNGPFQKYSLGGRLNLLINLLNWGSRVIRLGLWRFQSVWRLHESGEPSVIVDDDLLLLFNWVSFKTLHYLKSIAIWIPIIKYVGFCVLCCCLFALSLCSHFLVSLLRKYRKSDCKKIAIFACSPGGDTFWAESTILLEVRPKGGPPPARYVSYSPLRWRFADKKCTFSYSPLL